MSIISLYEKSDKLFFVGGVVRDEILGKTSPDIDLTYVGNAIEFANTLNFGEILQINEEFGSVHLKIEDKTIDITSTRIEEYPEKGQLPVVTKIGCSLQDDVKRRDFTVNAIAKNCKTGEIVDFVDGRKDLNEKKLRILHKNSFIDDPTRIIRGLKFAVRFEFELEEQTKKYQEEYLKNVDYNMSFKRLKDELIDAFNLDTQIVYDKFVNEKMYKLLSESEDFSENLCNIEEFIKPYKNEISNTWLIYLAGFDLKNLPLTKNEIKILEGYKNLLDKDFTSDFDIYKNFSNMPIESIIIYGVYNNLELVKKYLNDLRRINILITGKDLIELGYKPSKSIAKALEAVLRVKLKFPDIDKTKELEIARENM